MEQSIDKFRTCTFYARFPEVVKKFGYNELTFKEEKMEAQKRMEAIKEMKDKLLNEGLDPQFKLFPMYQFFLEAGPMKAYAVIQSQMGIANINLKVIGVFLFMSEATKAKQYMEKKSPNLQFTIQETKITQYKGR